MLVAPFNCHGKKVGTEVVVIAWMDIVVDDLAQNVFLGEFYKVGDVFGDMLDLKKDENKVNSPI